MTSALEATSALWTAREGDALILPLTPGDEFREHVEAQTGVARDQVHIVPGPGTAADPAVITGDVLLSREMIERVRSVVTAPEEWSLGAYYSDRTVAHLGDTLGISLPDHPFIREGGNELFNSKAIFRRLAAGAGVPVPIGGTASSPAMLERLLREILSETRAAIVKKDLSAGATGNVVISDDASTDFSGATHLIEVDRNSRFSELAQRLWEAQVPGGHGEVVVEEYHANSDSLYVELNVGDEGVDVLGWGRERMDPVWVGFEISRSLLSEKQREELLDVSVALGMLVFSLGYRGLMSVDAIIAENRNLYLNEINARVSGCTHIHGLLPGADLSVDTTVLTRKDVFCPSFKHGIEALVREGIEWTPQKGGVLLLSEDSLEGGSMEIMTAAPDEAQARALEKTATDLLNRAEW
ncbi:preATP grasp domain-containing protein [Nocardiopsis kunsanensis]|nr:hypothetical protein [Nocardiopsis kunsanensis]